MVFCSDLENPPAEGIADDSKTPQGAAVDVINAMGRILGVKIRIASDKISDIFAALDRDKCDVIMASLGLTPQRAEHYVLVNYWRVGSGMLVPRENPYHLTRYEDLSGRRALTLAGSRNEAVVKTLSSKLISEGKAPIKILSMPTTAAALQVLTLRQADALVSDSVVINDSLSKAPSRFATVKSPLPTNDWVIAIPKNRPDIQASLQSAVDELIESHMMQLIVRRWGIAYSVGLCSSQNACGE
ncbi:transporter substrate-binding domain-containing protein [Sodalis endosymbiont of Spalangia cameroni]|uniref:transporter substrate-binding domain-containing protein n=1 Tax=Sodalis praecaptivus TaxID=1239307 RepID=UPI0031F878B6